MTKKYILLVCGLLIGASLQASVVRNHKKLPQIQEFDTKRYLKDLAKLFATDWAALIAHELGHALTSKALTNREIDVHFGLTYQEDGNIFSLGGKPVTFHTIFPLVGFAYIGQSDSAWKNAAISLAGPLCGMTTYLLINAYNKWKEKRKPITKLSLDEIKKILIEAGCDSDIAYHAIWNLIPYGSNDGNHILKALLPNAPSKNVLFALCMKITQIVLQQKIIEHLKKEQERNPESLALDKEQAKQANRIYMILAHKTMGTFKEWSQDNTKQPNELTPDNTLTLDDIIYLPYLIKYTKSLKKVYAK